MATVFPVVKLKHARNGLRVAITMPIFTPKECNTLYLHPSNCRSYFPCFIDLPGTYYTWRIILTCLFNQGQSHSPACKSPQAQTWSLVLLMYPQGLKHFLSHNWFTIQTCWINEWMNKQLSLGRKVSSHRMWIRKQITWLSFACNICPYVH